MHKVSHHNKKRNTRQKERGVAETGKISGKYRVAFLHKPDNIASMVVELQYCRIHVDDVTYTQMKTALKHHEKERCAHESDDYDDKFFVCLSDA